MDVVTLQPDDDDGLAAFHEVTEQAQRHDRPHAVLESLSALTEAVRRPSKRYAQTLLLARDGTRPVGAAFVGFHLQENTHLVDLEVNVVPSARRQGIGSALHCEAAALARGRGCTTSLGEVHTPTGHDGDWPGMAFAVAHGYASVNQEDHLVLDLPAVGPTVVIPEGWEVIGWRDRCPEEYLEAYCEMRTQMESDVPIGEVDYAPTRRTPEQQRESEERLSASYTSLVAVARRRADGVLGGYSVLHLPHGTGLVWQDDTLVMPHHRGHRLGLALKAATLAALADHPGRSSIHTWTAVDNAPMQRTNAQFGFRCVERLDEVQRRLD